MTLRNLVVEISEQLGCRCQRIDGLHGLSGGQVDADDLGQRWRGGKTALEALGTCGVGGLQDGGALLVQGLSATEVHRVRGHEANAGVAMLIVVPSEELTQVGAGVLDACLCVMSC
jgi:hypothetical protein